MDIKLILTILASAIGFFGNIPYIIDALFHDTRPHAFTWLIWAITSWVAVAGLWIGGGALGSIGPTIAAIMATTIFFISLRFGKRDIRKPDILVLAIALFAIFVWLFLDNLLLAVIIVSFVDAIGYIPTLRKSYHEPYTETATSWGLFALSPALAFFALAEYNPLTMTYLLTIITLNSSLLVYLLVRRYMIKRKGV
jgi:hypothetical protein